MTDRNEAEASLLNAKAVEFYAATVNAWFNTRLEFDKSVLVLASGAIALLVGFLTTLGTNSLVSVVLYALSLACFLVAIGLVLTIYWRNSSHLAKIISNPDDAETNLLLYLDRGLIISFLLGVVISSLLAIISAADAYSAKKTEKEKEVMSKPDQPAFDSVHGAAQLQPKQLIQKSFQGAGALQPKASTEQPASGSQGASETPVSNPEPTSKP